MLHVLEFKRDFVPDRKARDDGTLKETGDLKPVDWVHYSSRGRISSVTTWARIKDLMPDERHSDEAAAAIWNIIGPQYEAWCKGEEIPETGTPLAAWAGVTANQITALRRAEVRTVEDLAEMTENQMNRAPLPNVRQLREMAAVWLEGRDGASMAERMAKLEQQNSDLRAAVDAAAAAEESEPQKPKRGRPRKNPDTEAA